MKGSLIQQFRKLVKFHGADLVFTGVAVKEIARIAIVTSGQVLSHYRRSS